MWDTATVTLMNMNMATTTIMNMAIIIMNMGTTITMGMDMRMKGRRTMCTRRGQRQVLRFCALLLLKVRRQHAGWAAALMSCLRSVAGCAVTFWLFVLPLLLLSVAG